VVLVLLLVLRHVGQAMVFWLSGLMIHLVVKLTMLGELLIVLRLCTVDHRGGVALLHHGVFGLFRRCLLLVHNELRKAAQNRSSVKQMRNCPSLVGFLVQKAVNCTSVDSSLQNAEMNV
jgi:hypothetical protein